MDCYFYIKPVIKKHRSEYVLKTPITRRFITIKTLSRLAVYVLSLHLNIKEKIDGNTTSLRSAIIIISTFCETTFKIIILKSFTRRNTYVVIFTK